MRHCLFSLLIPADEWQTRLSPIIASFFSKTWKWVVVYQSRLIKEFEQIRFHTDLGLY